ncbi:MAG TPA: UDP-N-acetylglucosamine 2-epimerase (non-hydrolyzing) [Candidatus Polarisedimenticolaceae bacterium]|nr:UDP-N-acetylglucosamine 2-epimerase (non-hydrolyzing) [Candidatus Polarisedimenticolaceae bacterium]
MKRTTVAVVAGTRPEAIKLAPVVRALAEHPRLEPKLILTGQHRELLDQALAAFGLDVAVDLDLMRPDQSLAETTARVVTGVGRTLREFAPCVVLVQGDTTTCLGAALAAFYEKLPLGHVEAGLRTHDLTAPWPEEMNRRLVDPISRWCFAPTSRAADNLAREGIAAERVFVTGNTVVDALLWARGLVEQRPPGVPGLDPEWVGGGRIVLVTLHRRESFGEPLRELCRALADIGREHPDVTVVFPVHFNPHVRSAVEAELAGAPRVRLIPPLEYLPFVHLLDRCHFVITDSGGIQEEAPSYGKPVLVARERTERPEAVDAGVARLVGTSRETIGRAARQLLTDRSAYEAMVARGNPFGDGRAAERIVEVLDEATR